MEDNILNSKSKKLVIGDFTIDLSRFWSDIMVEIPFSGMAFYQPKTSKEPNFYFKVDNIKDEKTGALLFGSSDFAVPTFLYDRADGYYDWLTETHDGKSQLSFRISEDWTDFTLYEDETGTNGERAFHQFGYLFSYAVLNHEACVLHGVVMEYNGKGILVTAASGTGKTTHTRMWRDRENALIINGDRCLCRKIGDNWYAYGMPWSGSSGEYINRKVKIDAIVSLKQAPTNYVKQMGVFDGTMYLLQRIFAPTWACDMQNKALDIVEDLASNIPMLELYCTPDYEAVDVLKEAILNLGE